MKPALPQEDFHTRLLNEHWNARHEETAEQIQARIDGILRKARRRDDETKRR